MADIIFLIAVVIEVCFVVFCFYSRSPQRQIRNYLRITALVLFVVLLAVSILQWSFRWYGLAALLFVWALLGLWSLLHKNTHKVELKAGLAIFRALGTLLIIWLVLLPAFIFPQHANPRVTGSHPVDTVSYSYSDPQRIETFNPASGNRMVNVQFWYPADGKDTYPLVVFSHGAFGMKGGNISTYTELASNGYVVCAIDHPYHALLTSDSQHHTVFIDKTFLQEVLDINNGQYNDAEAYKIEQKWLLLRTQDINFVLNTILNQTKNQNADPVYRLINPQKIGLMGHSLGAAASAQVARQRSDIGAVVNLDADLLGEYIEFKDGKNVLNPAPFPAPILSILADDMTRLINPIPDAENVVAVKHVDAGAPAAFEVAITGTDHQSLTDLPLISPLMVSFISGAVKKAGGGETADKYRVIETMNDLALSFFNVYLKSEGRFTPKSTY
ncbi:MAG: acetylhydrolase [Anaerolineae bacterium]|nr:acetylhydrolase [Anaerolineae bacterium]